MMNERYMQKKQCQTYKPRYRVIIDYLTPIGIFQFLFVYGMEERRSIFYPNLCLLLSVHDSDHYKEGEEGNAENCRYLILYRIDKDLLIKQCLLSGAGPRVSTTCHTSVTDYLS